jgi:hypothetical protein
MDVDTDTAGTGYGDCTDEGSRRFFHMQDANWNVTGLREDSHVVERYEYDPYGTVRIYKGYDAAAGHELLSVTSDSLK